jgi:flagellar assembly protein FliH
MTRPFPFADLKTGAVRADHGSTGGHDRSHRASGNDVSFPCLTFNQPGSKTETADGPTCTANELKAACEEARRATAIEVETETRAALAAELKHREVEALEAIRSQLNTSEAAFARWVSEVADVVQRLARMMAQALVPKALAVQPLADIEGMVRQSLMRLADQPSVELRVTPELVDRTGEHLSACAAKAGFRGELTTIGDTALRPGDAKLVWKNGVVHRDLARIQDDVDMIIDAWLGHQSAHPCLRAEVLSEPDQDEAEAAAEHRGLER